MFKVVFPVWKWYWSGTCAIILTLPGVMAEGRGLDTRSAEEVLRVVSAPKISAEQARTWPAWSDVVPVSKGPHQRFA